MKGRDRTGDTYGAETNDEQTNDPKAKEQNLKRVMVRDGICGE